MEIKILKGIVLTLLSIIFYGCTKPCIDISVCANIDDTKYDETRFTAIDSVCRKAYLSYFSNSMELIIRISVDSCVRTYIPITEFGYLSKHSVQLLRKSADGLVVKDSFVYEPLIFADRIAGFKYLNDNSFIKLRIHGIPQNFNGYLYVRPISEVVKSCLRCRETMEKFSLHGFVLTIIKGELNTDDVLLDWPEDMKKSVW